MRPAAVAMRTTVRKRYSNLSACDYETFIAAFPNMQAWRITAKLWVQPPLSVLGHRTMYRAAARVLSYIDIVGVVEELGLWLQLVCIRAGLRTCPPIGNMNRARFTPETMRCPPALSSRVRRAVQRHAEADVRLYSLAKTMFRKEADASQIGFQTRYSPSGAD
eukprot:CAMPEP_0119366326 /NCGR_PEP_ID=MMETSP1334-20130426/13191_1 /TAXON_ID=127549 /ORGANISM="Calcidiscus leptoporus, Strain RCC1130" /LENGTH=162 /DNA_ID=CAMNT_0007382509 /DNA_START=352 /DNA_END=840 /DNA_ORIENTATION=-